MTMDHAQNGVSVTTPPDAPDIADLGTADLLALRVELREHISWLFHEKSRLGGILRALKDGDAVAVTSDERTVRHQRRLANLEITAKSALLDRIKLRLFALQNAPRPKGEAVPRSTASTPDERAARLAQLDAAGPDRLLLRVAIVVRRVLDAAGGDMLAEEERRTLGDLSFYLRQKFGKPRVRESSLP
jgi:hypothetical protein